MNPARDDPSKPKPLPAANTTISYGPDGRVLQKNEGKWDFLISSNQNALFLDMEVSKFLDSSFINVRVEARFIQIVIKNKVLTVSLDEDVVPEAVICERSTLSGNLVVSMLKASAPDGTDIEEVVRKHKSRHADKKEVVAEGKGDVARNRRKERLFGKNYTDSTNERDGSEDSKGLKIFDSKFSLNMDENPYGAGFVDDPDVPPLC
ncbi:Protein tilB [Chytriomyces hyalinus]|nr:Protein tilB [Chytriomyces hyalinus]